MQFAPVFKKDGNEFILAYQDLLRESLAEADELGQTIEDHQGVEYGFVYTENVIYLPITGCSSRMSDLKVIVVAGPILDQARDIPSDE